MLASPRSLREEGTGVFYFKPILGRLLIPPRHQCMNFEECMAGYCCRSPAVSSPGTSREARPSIISAGGNHLLLQAMCFHLSQSRKNINKNF